MACFQLPIGLIRYPQARTVFLGYGIENFTKMSDFIYSTVNTTKEKGIFIISDLGFNDDFIDICKPSFSCARLNGWQILSIDHHPWSEKAIEAVKPFIEIVLDTSGKKCAADLMYETFLAGHDLASKLASIAHTTDFFTKDQYLAPTSELIRYYHNFPNFYERLSNLAQKSAAGVLWDIEMQSQYNEYVLLRELQKSGSLLQFVPRKHVKHLRVAFVQIFTFYTNQSIFRRNFPENTGGPSCLFWAVKVK